MNKFKFVKQLLENEKFNNSQKERFFKLVSQELELSEEIDNKVLEDIRLIKEQLGITSTYSPDRIKNEPSGGEEGYDFLKIFLDQIKSDNYKKQIDLSKDPRDVNFLEKQVKLMGIRFNLKYSLLDRLNKKHSGINLLEIREVVDKYYFTIIQQEIKAGLYENIGINRKTQIIPVDILGEIFEKPETKDPTNRNLSEYLNPKHLHDFLLEYNQNPILKYTCHTIDDNDRFNNILKECKTDTYEFDKHLEVIHRNFNNLTYKYSGKVLKNVIGLMSTYLGTYNKYEGWSENIKIKWTSEDLKLWCNENIGKVPNPLDVFQEERFNFQTIELKNGNTISNFSDLVIYFKHLFHIKSSNPLKYLIEESIFFNFNDDEKYNFLFDENFSNNIDLFTYTEALIQAFKKIINISKNQYNDTVLNVKLFFDYDETKLKEFKIVILNSKIFGKNFCDFRPGDDLRSLIKEQVNGLCDLYIKAYFEDKKSVGIVNVWNGKEMEFKECSEEIEGVEFILKMY